MKPTVDYNCGDVAVLCEDGGEAVVEILSKSTAPREGYPWIAFRIRFMIILRQYPYTPYYAGNEIEVGMAPDIPRQPMSWHFEPVEGESV
jgi:hypothetical protein